MKQLSPILAAALLCLAFSPSTLFATDNIARLNLLAEKYEQAGKLSEALQIHRHIITLDPTQQQSHKMIELIDAKLKKNPSSINSANPSSPASIVQPQKKSPVPSHRKTVPAKRSKASVNEEQRRKDDITIENGFKAIESNQLDEAMALFEQILKRRSKNTLSLLGKAQIHAQRKEWKEVLTTLKREARINKDPKIQELHKQALNNIKTVPENIEKKSPKEEFSKRMKTAEDLLSENDLNGAEAALISLYVENPSNPHIQLRLAETYSKMKQFGKAREFYQSALAFSPKNINAQMGVASSLYALKEYHDAFLAYEKIDKKNWTSQLEYDYKVAKISYLIEIKKYDEAQKIADELYQKYPNNINAVRQVAELADILNPYQAIRYRTLAYQISHQNNDLISLVYTLINAGQFSQAEIYFNSLRGKHFLPEETAEFKKLYLIYYRKLSSAQLNDKEFKSAERTCRSGLLIAPNDIELTETYGWVLFNLKKYTEALQKFEELLNRQSTSKAYYAAALTAHNLKNNKKSYGYLFQASQTRDIYLLEKIAELYHIMGYQEEKLETLKLIENYRIQDPSAFKAQPNTSPLNNDLNGVYNPFLSQTFFLDNFELKSNQKSSSAPSLSSEQPNDVFNIHDQDDPSELKKKLLTYKENSLSGGFFFENRSGVSGIDRLTKTVVPIDITLNPSSKHSFQAGVNSIKLYTDDFSSLSDTPFGDGQNFGGNGNIEEASAFEPYIGYSYHNEEYDIEMFLSTTPLNDVIGHSTPTGYIQATVNVNPWTISLRALQKSIDETILSYIGQKDPDTYESWGRIVRRGIEATLNYSEEWKASLGLGIYPSIKGFNTIENSESKATLFIGKNIIENENNSFLLGPLIVLDKYDHSSNHFTYGHGGYFSPTSYSLFSLYGDYNNQFDSASFIRIKSNIGYSIFEESEEPFLPFTPDGRMYRANQNEGFTFTVKGYGGVEFSPNLHFIGMVGYSMAPQYNNIMAGCSLTYYFDKHAELTPKVLEQIPYYWNKFQ